MKRQYETPGIEILVCQTDDLLANSPNQSAATMENWGYDTLEQGDD